MLGCIYLSTPLEPFVEGAHDVSGGHPEIRRGKSEVTAVTTVGRSLPYPVLSRDLAARSLQLKARTFSVYLQ